MARTVATELKGDEETAFEHCPHPGASLVGRPVRKLFEDPEVPEEFRRYHGAVTGVRPHDTFQQVYVVRYDDGEEEELTFEELMPVLEGSLEGTVPRDVLDSAGRMSFSRVKLLRAGIGKGNTFRGVHAGTDAMGRHGFIGCVTDDSGIEHCFAFTFPIRAGAAAAHDLLVRRILAGGVKVTTKPNFPDVSWADLCGVMLFGARDEHFPPLPSPPPALPPTTEPPVKKKKRDPKAPHCEYVGNRLYDSQLGVTCHWCRQKTVEVHAICTRRECAEQVTPNGEIRARLPVAFCGPCLKNRNGEDVVAAVASGTWICPKCRGSCGPGCDGCCNCGPCRRRKGLPHTGQLAPEARERGFTNAHDYLVHLATGESQVELLRRKKSHWWGAWLIAPGERSSPSATMSLPTPPGRAPPIDEELSERAVAADGAGLAVPANRILASAVGSTTAAVADVRHALENARDMMMEGMISESEFDEMKARILRTFTAAA